MTTDFDLLYAQADPGAALCRWALTGALPGEGGGAEVALARRTCARCDKPLGPLNRTGYCKKHAQPIYNQRWEAKRRAGVVTEVAREAEPPAAPPAPPTLPPPICPDCGEEALVFADFGRRCTHCATGRRDQTAPRSGERGALRLVS